MFSFSMAGHPDSSVNYASGLQRLGDAQIMFFSEFTSSQLAVSSYKAASFGAAFSLRQGFPGRKIQPHPSKNKNHPSISVFGGMRSFINSNISH